ncbi:MAG: O-antigen ligase family protein, partial [Candidatus Kerfeldbacteria bacterium]|nr:O-antigen ligase family protein [Candidatus Kerfeldbacteria bacterium]
MSMIQRHTLQRFGWPFGGAIAMLVVGWLIGSHLVIGTVAVAAIVLGIIVALKPEAVFIVSLLTIVAGQLIRLPIAGGDSSILPNDVILPVLFIVWTWRRLMSRRWSLPRHSLTVPITTVIVVMAVSLLVNVPKYAGHELVSGALYFFRWLEYLTIFWMGLDFFRTRERSASYLQLMTWTGVALAVLGFIQLRLFPDFSFMVPQGWDPHVGRLLSTWFDPNFLGGYLALLTTIAFTIALSRGWWAGRWWWAAVFVMTVAIILTFSRSGYVGLVAGVGIVTAFRSRALLFVGLLAGICLVLFVPRIQERVIGVRTIDETAQLRLVSYRNALEVIRDHPVIGVGYNLYKYTQVQYGFLDDTKE